MTAFPKLLVANRGEIAVRILRAARNLGLETVAVFSEADAGAPHVAMADEAVCLGPAPADQSYLSIDRVLEAARLTQATLVHPGYGFLSENAEFASACAKAGLVFVGPSPQAIALMGSKAEARRAAEAIGVPVIPGYDGADQDDKRLTAEAARIGYPVMVKAEYGGGGRGLRLVQAPSDLAEALTRARSEALAGFGRDSLILEKAIMGARHIEVQILADAHGHVVHLCERDCSIQRRHQKVIEEAPSPFVDADLRAHLGQYAVSLVQACGYVGAGTVEFLVDADRQPWFLEMNTRLQVEHPVTELVTSVDLVDWQIRIAMGEALSFGQEDVTISGHAIEARLYAEDPANGFLPQTGRILHWRAAERQGLRYDMGIETGSQVSAHYDPMLGKIIAWGADRPTAIRRLAAALVDSDLLGVQTNVRLLIEILHDAAFADGKHDLTTLDVIVESVRPPETGDETLAAVAAVLLHQLNLRPDERGSIAQTPVAYALSNRGNVVGVSVIRADGVYAVEAGSTPLELRLGPIADGRAAVLHNGIWSTAVFATDTAGGIALQYRGYSTYFANASYSGASGQALMGDGRLTAAMEGVVVAVLCAPGDTVEANQPLIVMESMKMEHQIRANADAIVESVAVQVGDKVFQDQPLAKLTTRATLGE